MSYFSSKSTWLSLVDGPEALETPARNPDGLALGFEDYRPCFPGVDEPAGSAEARGGEDPESLRIACELRHRLFFHFKEWEFGPGLFEDTVRLAQAQTVPEEALAHYCHARVVAKTLVERWGQEGFLIAWLETDRVIAEIQDLIGNRESCRMFAREGLETIKRNRFPSDMDLRITKLAVRFFKLLDLQ